MKLSLNVDTLVYAEISQVLASSQEMSGDLQESAENGIYAPRLLRGCGKLETNGKESALQNSEFSSRDLNGLKKWSG